MTEEILAVLSPEQRAILAPHTERFTGAEREYAEAKQTLLLTLHALFPGKMVEGVRFDTVRSALVREGARKAPDRERVASVLREVWGASTASGEPFENCGPEPGELEAYAARILGEEVSDGAA